MKIIAGLGNPGDQYRLTRHNMGFLVVDALAEESGIAIQKKKFEALLGDGRIAEHRVLIAKPQTFMNLSGISVRQVLDFYQKTAGDLLVVHDDLDLSFGTVRVKVGGGDGGHKGIRSLIEHLGVANFTRVRLGIGKPSIKEDVERYVLWRRLAADPDWGDPLVSIPSGQASYVYSDATVSAASSYYYAVAGEDCTPSMSSQLSSNQVTIP